MVSTSVGKGIANLKGTSGGVDSELKARERLASDQTFDLYFRLGEIQDELLDLVKARKSEPAVQAFLVDHVNPRLEDLRAGVHLTKTQRKLLNHDLHPRSENSYLNIIASLHDMMAGKSKLPKKHPNYVDQSKLINDMVDFYGEYPGISKSNLEKVFPRAQQSLKF
jgi:hypothetical protein|tara:strand:+ start:251 stop:748 length:498 start_codon:yes stop_codon:yes gene_type:complete